jgi:hypothetical protein
MCPPSSENSWAMAGFRSEAGTLTPASGGGQWGGWDQAGTGWRPRTSLPGRASVGTPFSAITSPLTIVAT